VAFRFRSLKKVDWALFQDDLRQSELFTSPAENADEFAEQLDAVSVDIQMVISGSSRRQKTSPST